MVSTVTTSTVTTVTTVAMLGLGIGFGILVTATLLSLVTAKEFASAGDGKRRTFLSQLLNVGIVPLIIVFIFIVVFSVLQAMG